MQWGNALTSDSLSIMFFLPGLGLCWIIYGYLVLGMHEEIGTVPVAQPWYFDKMVTQK